MVRVYMCVYVCMCIDVPCISPCGVLVLEGAANGLFILLFKGSNPLALNWYIGKPEGVGFTVCALLLLLMKWRQTFLSWGWQGGSVGK